MFNQIENIASYISKFVRAYSELLSQIIDLHVSLCHTQTHAHTHTHTHLHIRVPDVTVELIED